MLKITKVVILFVKYEFNVCSFYSKWKTTKYSMLFAKCVTDTTFSVMIYLMSNDDAILIKTSPMYMFQCSKQKL